MLISKEEELPPRGCLRLSPALAERTTALLIDKRNFCAIESFGKTNDDDDIVDLQVKNFYPVQMNER
ncbi:hypothetical protein T4B_8381 [Trichinella pseudospiralis]|uniref:Uncharacterized protein n=1 Tax=Trichinella pseudospiralis TaxID=6337 RepID=A0A0V1IS25_TRIPS|nr:hypothetical protein T4A_8519 [Trichinella pseudospiralis]KRZ25570.1 hypothetical protein T4B_8381 [Trichinella pseudospiralis]